MEIVWGVGRGYRVQLIYIGFKERQTQLEKDGTGETERKKRER